MLLFTHISATDIIGENSKFTLQYVAIYTPEYEVFMDDDLKFTLQYVAIYTGSSIHIENTTINKSILSIYKIFLKFSTKFFN